MVRHPMKSLGFNLYRSKLNLPIPFLLGWLELGRTRVHISPSCRTMTGVLAGRDWKKASESTTVPSSSSTRMRNWHVNRKALAVWSRRSSREAATTPFLCFRLWVQSLKGRGLGGGRIRRESVVWIVDTDLTQDSGRRVLA